MLYDWRKRIRIERSHYPSISMEKGSYGGAAVGAGIDHIEDRRGFPVRFVLIEVIGLEPLGGLHEHDSVSEVQAVDGILHARVGGHAGVDQLSEKEISRDLKQKTG